MITVLVLIRVSREHPHGAVVSTLKQPVNDAEEMPETVDDRLSVHRHLALIYKLRHALSEDFRGRSLCHALFRWSLF